MIPAAGMVLAVGLIAFGHWGRRNAAKLVQSALSPYGRAVQFHQYRRGATTCLFVGVFVLFAAVFEAF